MSAKYRLLANEGESIYGRSIITKIGNLGAAFGKMRTFKVGNLEGYLA